VREKILGIIGMDLVPMAIFTVYHISDVLSTSGDYGILGMVHDLIRVHSLLG